MFCYHRKKELFLDRKKTDRSVKEEPLNLQEDQGQDNCVSEEARVSY